MSSLYHGLIWEGSLLWQATYKGTNFREVKEACHTQEDNWGKGGPSPRKSLQGLAPYAWHSVFFSVSWGTAGILIQSLPSVHYVSSSSSELCLMLYSLHVSYKHPFTVSISWKWQSRQHSFSWIVPSALTAGQVWCRFKLEVLKSSLWTRGEQWF